MQDIVVMRAVTLRGKHLRPGDVVPPEEWAAVPPENQEALRNQGIVKYQTGEEAEGTEERLQQMQARLDAERERAERIETALEAAVAKITALEQRVGLIEEGPDGQGLKAMADKVEAMSPKIAALEEAFDRLVASAASPSAPARSYHQRKGK